MDPAVGLDSGLEQFLDPADPAHRLANKYTLNSKNVVSSAYWKVPDSKSHLTSVACHESDPLVAVASGTRDSNLFIYEVNAPQDDRYFPPSDNGYYSYPSTVVGNQQERPASSFLYDSAKLSRRVRPNKGAHKRSVSEGSPLSDSSPASPSPPSLDQQASPILTHHQTISLGGIHSLAWVSSQHKLGSHGNVLATGHNSGLVHLVLLPDPYATNGPAEIIHRFNHARHLSSDKIVSSRIRTINLASSAWTCCPQSCIVSLFSEHLYMWDPARPEKPIIVQRARRARSFNISPLRNGIVSLATDRGISIMDVRYKNPVALAPPNDNTGLVSLVKWSTGDENRVASVHDQTLIKIWDIRTGSPLLTLEGHYDKINSIEWSKNSADEFYSASADGTVRMWDINKCTDSESSGTSSEVGTCDSGSTLSSPASDSSSFTAPLRRHRRARSEADTSADWLPSQKWRLYRQRLARENSLPSYNYFLDNQNPHSPCTTIFSNNKEFLGLATINMPVHGGMGAMSKPHLVSIDNSGFFGIHSKISPDDIVTSKQEELASDISYLCKNPYKDSSPLASRPSYESLVSKSSKSAGEEFSLDHHLDDSTSDTSSSSTPSSPRSESRRDSTDDDVSIFRNSSPPSHSVVPQGNVPSSIAKPLETKPLFVNKQLPELPSSLTA